jgi:hypothetical protein
MRRIAICFVAASFAWSAPVRADSASSEAEVGTPAPEATVTEPVASDASAEPGFEGAPDPSTETPITAAPIEAVHRPAGFWGPVAVAADLLVLRPIGAVSLFAGSAAFVLVSPIAAATGTLGDRAEALVDRAENVFTRPLGAL